MVRVLVPSFSTDLLDGLIQSMDRSSPMSRMALIVGDNGLSYRPPGPTYIDVPGRSEVFCYAKAVNLMAAACPDDDFVILEDDMAILTDDWPELLEEQIALWPTGYGVLQLCQHPKSLGYLVIEQSATTVGLGISLIPRRVWNDVGAMDERYIGYGWEDTDWCVRALHKGYALGTTGSVEVDHLGGQVGYVRRAGSYDALMVRCHDNRRRFQEKWGLPDDPEIKFQDAAPHYLRTSCGCRADG